MPCFDNSIFIDETLASLRRQTTFDFELILVDDGSSDAAAIARLDAIEAEKASYEFPVELYRRPHRGAPAARNFGALRARGEYLFLLDSDDLVAPSALEKLALFAQLNPSKAYVYCCVRHFGAIVGVDCSPFDGERLKRENFLAVSCLIRRSAFLDIGGFDEALLNSYEDYDLWLRLLAAGREGALLPEPLFSYRRHDRGYRAALETHGSIADMMAILRGRHPRLYGGPEPERSGWKLLEAANDGHADRRSGAPDMFAPRAWRREAPNVLYLAPDFVHGGAGQSDLDFIAGLTRLGCAVTVVGRPAGGDAGLQALGDDLWVLPHLTSDLSQLWAIVDYLMVSRAVDVVVFRRSSLGEQLAQRWGAMSSQVRFVDVERAAQRLETICEDAAGLDREARRADYLARLEARGPLEPLTETPAPARSCVLVLGMHRSGTSALTRVLSLLGAGLPKHLIGPAKGNETGHWEPERLIGLNDRMLAEGGTVTGDWRTFDVAALPPERFGHYRDEVARVVAEEYGDAPLFVLKDPRVSRCLPIYLAAFAELGVEAKPVHILRNPLAVAASLEKRDSMTRDLSCLVWLRYTLDAETYTRGRRRVFVRYEDLMQDWRATIARIGDGLAIPFAIDGDAEAAIAAFLSPERMHERNGDDDVLSGRSVSAWVRDAYRAAPQFLADAQDRDAQAKFDDLRGRLIAAAQNLGQPVAAELSARRQTMASEYEASIARLNSTLAERDQAIARGDASAETLAAALAERSAEVEALAAAHAESEARIEGLAAANVEGDARIEALRADIAEREVRIAGLATANEQRVVRIARLESAAAERLTRIGALEADNAGQAESLRARQTEIEQRDARIAALEARALAAEARGAQWEVKVAELRYILARARKAPLKLLRDKLGYRLLHALLRSGWPLSEATRRRFERSAAKRNPKRSLKADAEPN